MDRNNGSASGVLLTSIVSGLLLGLLLSVVLLIAYRRSLRRLMHQNAELPDDSLLSPSFALESDASVPINQSASTNLLETATTRRRRCAIIYTLSGGACLAALSMFWLSVSGAVHFVPFLVVFVFKLWPLILTLSLILCWTWRRTLLYSLAYFALLAVTIFIEVQRGSKNTAAGWILSFVLFNGAPTILFRAVSFKGIRQIGPTLLPLCLVAVAGPLTLLNIGSVNSSVAARILHLSQILHLGVLSGTALSAVLSLAVMGLVGWIAAYAVVLLYKSQKISDQSLLIDSIWILYVGTEAISLLFQTGSEGGSGTLWMILALPLYLIGVHAGLRIVGLSRSTQPTSLLVLRAFALKAKAERVFQPVTSLWRYVGPVRLIGGPDLASSTIQPDSFFEFATGHMSRLFIRSSASLDRRLKTLTLSPDFDGRFRVQDLFCHGNTWQLAVTRLLHSSDLVLADFRGLSDSKRGGRGGCEWEVCEIASSIGLDRCIFLLDGPQDEAYLHSVLAPVSLSPNPAVRILHGVGDSERSLRQLIPELFADRSAPSSPIPQFVSAD